MTLTTGSLVESDKDLALSMVRVRALRSVGVPTWAVRDLQTGEALELGREYEMLASEARPLVRMGALVVIATPERNRRVK